MTPLSFSDGLALARIADEVASIRRLLAALTAHLLPAPPDDIDTH
jgi:hypothetical protein